MRYGPLLVTFVVGTALVAIFFIPHHKAQEAQSVLLDWANVVYAFALILGSLTLWASHQRKFLSRAEGWPYSLVAVLSLGFGAVAGVVEGVEEGTLVNRYCNVGSS